MADGLLFGNPAQLGIQAVAVARAMVYSGVGTFVLLKVVGLVVPAAGVARQRIHGPRHVAARRRGVRSHGRFRDGLASSRSRSR